MVKQALSYSTELKEKFIETWGKEEYKFFNSSGYNMIPEILETNWKEDSFVVLDNNEIKGFIAYSIDRNTNSVTSLQAINFDLSNRIIFSQGLKSIIRDIFEKHDFNKLVFGVVVGNPIEKSYDRITKLLNGHIVGTYKRDVRIDNVYYDYKIYEIMREDYYKFKEHFYE